MKYASTLFVLMIFFSISVCAQQNNLLNSGEKILFNAKIFTGDVEQPYAEAVAIKENKVIAVGNFETIKKLISKNAVLIDMHGACILPGFVDSHSHALQGGDLLSKANLFDSAVTVDQIAAYADEVKKNGKGMTGDFLIIEGINLSTWSHIKELNDIFSDGAYAHQPFVLRGSDGHTQWGNKAVLDKAGIDKKFIAGLLDTDKKFYGADASGEPNGFTVDDGMAKIDAVVPKENTDWIQAGENAIEYNNSLGITAWLDPAAGDIEDKRNEYLEAYQLLSVQNKLTAHVAAIVVANADEDPAKQISKLKSLQTKYNTTKNLSVIGFKIFADGVIEFPSQTAALSKPYLNKNSNGALMMNPQKFANFATLADKNNLLVHVHAIGDLAVTESLNGFQAARKANGNSGIPHTITHLQIVLPKDFARFKQLGVLASYQLLWAYGDVTTIDIVQPYIDPSLYKWQYPARSMLQAGATICGASDWPVSSANPFLAIYNAETRLGTKGVLDSTQCMPRMAMLYAYTINAAKALRSGRFIGSITPGKFADLILVDRDVLTVSPEAMEQTKVLWTMFEGKIVYEAK